MPAAAPPPTGLPVEEVIPAVRQALADGPAVLQATPGAGKTTVVPLRLMDESWLNDGRIVMLEPRRVAARAAAGRMADLLGEEVGATVGYVTRDDRRTSSKTRIEVVTDGVLTRRLQHDPSLPGTALVVFDEFHERHLQSDLGLALTLDAREALRPDLRVLAMSATLDGEPLAALLGAGPVLTCPGRQHPVEVRWAPSRPTDRLSANVTTAILRALRTDTGDVLVFVPGVGEIRAVERALGPLEQAAVLPLHGGLPAAEQDRALRVTTRRRVVLATDLAESSVTVEGVSVVIDAGLARRPSYDPASGLTRLRTVVASRASADQRAGRAGRLGPGVAYRLWSEAEHGARRAWADPEILTVDLAGLALELAAWGARAGDLHWLDAPPEAALATASALLEELGVLAAGRPTDFGRRLADVPLHPRLGVMLLSASRGARRTAGLLAALLSERDVLRRDRASPSADVADRIAALRNNTDQRVTVDRDAAAVVRRRADELVRRVGRDHRRSRPDRGGRTEEDVDPGPLLATAYPDRMAQSRGGGRYRLRHGGGAVLPDHDPLAGSEWLVAADVSASAGGMGRADGLIRLAAPLDRADVERVGGQHIRTETELRWDPASDDLRAITVRRLDALVLDRSQGPARPGPATTEALVARAVERQLADVGWTPAARALQARVGWARQTLGDGWPDVGDAALAATAGDWLTPALARASSRRDLQRVDPATAIRSAIGGRGHELDQLVPAAIRLPGGRRLQVDYSGERPRVSARAQDFYGVTVHPAVLAGRVPVSVELLSPAGRPLQVTADLPGFWAGTWRQVRKEMLGRYPRHSWPDDPGTPPAAARPRH
jgi:ATP-dependent helicase HrpB